MAELDEGQQELARELEAQMMALRVEDVLMQSLVTVSAIGFRRLGLSADTREERDLGQSQLSISAIEALTPVIETFLPDPMANEFKASSAQLKLGFARAASEEASPGDQGPGNAEEETAATTGGPGPADAESDVPSDEQQSERGESTEDASGDEES